MSTAPLIHRYRRAHPATRAEAAAQRPRPLYRRHQAAAHAARLLRAEPASACQGRIHRRRGREERARASSRFSTAADINPRCEPFVGVALHRPGHRSAPQSLLAADRAVWQGQPVAIVVADSRGEAEDAAELVAIEWEPLPAVGRPDAGHRAGRAGRSIPTLGDNVAFDFAIEKGEPAKAFAEADFVIEEELRFERQMAMTLEARGLIADFNPGDGSLTVIHAHQSPFQMQTSSAGTCTSRSIMVRVIAPDIGGGFGMKLNIYSDEIATVGGEHDARPPGQVLRRPAGVLRLRRPSARPSHQVPHRAEELRRDHWRWRWTTSARSAPMACRCASMSPKA